MMNKKGENEEGLPDNLVGIVVALLVLLVVAGGALGAYYNYSFSTELESARDIASFIEAGIGQYTGKGSGSISLQGTSELSEKEWYITAWSKNEEGRPDKCFFEACIMVCPSTSKSECSGNLLTCEPHRSKDCQQDGFPRDIKKYEKIVIETETTMATTEFIRVGTEEVAVPGTKQVSVNYIPIPNALFVLDLEEKTEEDGTKYLSISLK